MNERASFNNPQGLESMWPILLSAMDHDALKLNLHPIYCNSIQLLGTHGVWPLGGVFSEQFF